MAVPDAIRGISGYSAFRRHAIHGINRVRQPGWARRRIISTYLTQHRPAKLNIGCGTNILRGWLNTEFEGLTPPGVLCLDATRRFPFSDASFDYIFSEHMIEHVPLAGAMSMLRECQRVLKPGGSIRVATPRLEFLMDLLTNPTDEHRRYADQHYADFVEEPELRTPARIANDYYRMWGHQFVYDEPTLRLMLERAGFSNLRVAPVGDSNEAAFRGIENVARMPDGMLALTTLVIEGQKGSAST